MTDSISIVDGDPQPAPQNFHRAVIEFEEKLIRQALAETNNKPTAAARLLGLHRRSLQRKLSKDPVRR